MRSLRTWLALGLAAAIAAPAAAGLGAWVLAGDWQTARVQDAIDVLSNSSIDDWTTVSRKLSRFGVEAELTAVKPADRASIDRLKTIKAAGRGLITPGLEALQQSADFKRQMVETFRTQAISGPGIKGMLYVRREGSTVRWAIALGAGAVALAAYVTASNLHEGGARVTAQFQASEERRAQ